MPQPSRWNNGQSRLIPESITREISAAITQRHPYWVAKQNVFLLAHLHLDFQPDSIRSVSTKLKSQFGPNKSLSDLPKREVTLLNGIDPLDGFQVNLASIQPLNIDKGSREVFYSDRTNLQIDQDLHPEHGTLAPVVTACPPKYLPASTSATYLMRSNWRLCSSQVLRPAKEWLDVTGTF